MLHTTFRLAHEGGACPTSYRAVAKGLGGIRGYGRDTPIALSYIHKIRGPAEAMWCLRVVLPSEEEHRRVAASLACDYVDHVAGLWRPVPGVEWQPADALSVLRRFISGTATRDELDSASGAARRFAGALGWTAQGIARAAWLACEGNARLLLEIAWEAQATVSAMAAGESAQEARLREWDWQVARFVEYLEKTP